MCPEIRGKQMFVCRNCGYKTLKWLGKCPECGIWESFIQQEQKAKKIKAKELTPVKIVDLSESEEIRISTNIGEFDRVLGGGLVKGEVVLIGGEPGVGKSTLLLQAAAKLSENQKVLYLTAEESLNQISLRAKRLGIDSQNLFIISEDNIENIQELFNKDFAVIIIDSIQVVHLQGLGSSRGSLLQVRESANLLTESAKKNGISLFIAGHVTKEGAIAGPKVLEHIVDCVIYFDGEKNSNFRILRAIKNRFGSVGEIGVFQMTASGLEQVDNPSSFFISKQDQQETGKSISCVLEGIRPVLVEIQALVTKGNFGMARRKVSGMDFNRFSLLVAMMEKRLGLRLGDQDVFVKVTGGMKINDPAVDLALAVAIISSYKDIFISNDAIFIAELGLSGELRKAHNIDSRLKEAERLGFSQAFISGKDAGDLNPAAYKNMEILGFNYLNQIVESLQGK
jgi:DNA repair protein RadA/Sms